MQTNRWSHTGKSRTSNVLSWSEAILLTPHSLTKCQIQIVCALKTWDKTSLLHIQLDVLSHSFSGTIPKMISKWYDHNILYNPFMKTFFHSVPLRPTLVYNPHVYTTHTHPMSCTYICCFVNGAETFARLRTIGMLICIWACFSLIHNFSDHSGFIWRNSYIQSSLPADLMVVAIAMLVNIGLSRFC